MPGPVAVQTSVTASARATGVVKIAAFVTRRTPANRENRRRRIRLDRRLPGDVRGRRRPSPGAWVTGTNGSSRLGSPLWAGSPASSHDGAGTRFVQLNSEYGT